MRSIRSHINVGLGISLALTLLAAGIGGSYGMRLLVEQWLVTRLDHDAESLLMGLTVDQHSIALSDTFQDPIYRRPFSGHYYQIDTDARRLRSRSLWDSAFDVPVVGVGKVETLRAAGPQDQVLLVRVAGYEKAGQHVSVAVAEDLSPLRTSVQRYQAMYLLFSALILTLMLLLQRRVLTAGFRPLRDTAEQLAELEEGTRQQLSGNFPSEIRPLATEINGLLQLLQQRVERSRNSLGNLAHALKTPMAVLWQLVERPAMNEHPEIQEQFRAQLAALQQRVDAELRRSRLAGRGYRGSRVKLQRELNALADVMSSVHRAKGLSIEVDVPTDLSYQGDKEDLMELFGNLLDNACKWADRRVKLSASGGEWITVQVEDDGPGQHEEELDRLSERGVRADTGAVPGHGLGLSIVQDIVEQFGGELKLGRSEALGGFRAEVTLPR